MRRLLIIPLFGLLVGVLAQGVPMPQQAQVRQFNVKAQEMLGLVRDARVVLVFGPSLPFPLTRELMRDKTLEVIAGLEAPPSWTKEAERLGAQVRAYLLPGKIAPGAFMLLDDLYLVSPAGKDTWQVVQSREVVMVVRAYMRMAMDVARQMGVVQ